MVTFAAATRTTSTIPPRAPAQRRVDHFVAFTCSDPNDSFDLYSDDCRSHAQLVSPSRDPIGYHDGKNQYNYLETKILSWLDPSGTCKQCCPDDNLFKHQTLDCGHVVREFRDNAGNPFNVNLIGVDFRRRWAFFPPTYSTECDCSCCRLRQYVVRSNSDLVLVSADGKPIGIRAPGMPMSGEPGEDCFTTPSGIRRCYGNPDWNEPPNNVVKECQVYMRDTPGLLIDKYIAKAKQLGETLEYKFTLDAAFKQEITDTCNKDMLIREDHITAKCDITFIITPGGIVSTK